jgi:hypothetical protein
VQNKHFLDVLYDLLNHQVIKSSEDVVRRWEENTTVINCKVQGISMEGFWERRWLAKKCHPSFLFVTSALMSIAVERQY